MFINIVDLNQINCQHIAFLYIIFLFLETRLNDLKHKIPVYNSVISYKRLFMHIRCTSLSPCSTYYTHKTLFIIIPAGRYTSCTVHFELN